MHILFIVLLFFFFKQKTAYEMRISDWSSDVCSSDLWHRSQNPWRQTRRQGRLRQAVANPPRVRDRDGDRMSCSSAAFQGVAVAALLHPTPGLEVELSLQRDLAAARHDAALLADSARNAGAARAIDGITDRISIREIFPDERQLPPGIFVADARAGIEGPEAALQGRGG